MKTSMKMSLVLTAACCLVSAYADPLVEVKSKADLTSLRNADMKGEIITIRNYGEIHSRNTFQVKPSARYKVSADMRLVSGKGGNVLLGFGPKTAKGVTIYPAHVCVRAKTFTELAAPAKKGDKVLTVKNAAGWELKSPYNYVVFNAKEDFSDLPNMSGVRQVKGAVARKGEVWEIKLTNPVKKDYPVGTKVRQQYDASTYMYARQIGKLPGTWTHVEGIASGIVPTGNPGSKFWKGTEKADLIIVFTGNNKSVMEVKNFQAEEVK